ncbi:hypothetical protein SUGI_0019430 [Cryptomeria japonica]|uniref:jacalin-related lectin 19 n=1 Tax=Cryptomeria japonica TaxID=3369 RepID=UPI002408CF49|nr:jacalin-related lectin 19 [Cryptomeria japonica]XP_057813610.2 jacalin-related lectin 19 [Cryptomeria japonica]XP_057813618.2 jacalin-related lectin 19 [Cryptomeria japonica]GLJ05514.1 hypothetical protein SUGI_0019430 [Cryptomeria japonica]
MSLQVGPWGGSGGTPWDDGVYTGVKTLHLVHASCIDSLRIEYDKGGRSVWSEKHGGDGGATNNKIQFNYPYEILTSISGHYGHMSPGTPCVIRSLIFHTNVRKHGPYGVEQGTYFSFPTSGGKIKGFHGRSGWYLDSIGVYLAHAHEPTLWEAIKVSAKNILRG